ncbi:MAG: Maf family nucleotide pyrophosphatase [Candidatus Methylopumilus sp.]|nr:Maf family nucleotide pyrophosphatase [Candidatus Methylopumilus sp.]
MTPRLILASSSKYRQELLSRLKIPFLSVSPDVDETPFPNEPPEQLALRLAIAKAQRIAQAYPKHVVIGADQVASLHDLPLGKPGHAAAAHMQLQQLSGQTVTFFSAMAVVLGSHVQSTVVPTHCVFRHLSEAAIARYIAIDQPFDTAGSAKAECLGIALMQSMHSSDPTSIIGLPLIELTKMLAQVGLDPLDEHIQ